MEIVEIEIETTVHWGGHTGSGRIIVSVVTKLCSYKGNYKGDNRLTCDFISCKQFTGG